MKACQKTGLLLLIVSWLLSASCKKYNYYEFTPADSEWMIYSEGQQLKFQNQGGIIRNYECYGIYRGYIINGNDYNAMVSINFQLPTDTVNEKGKFQLEKKKEATQCSFTWPRFTPPIILNSEPVVSDSIGGKFYSDLIIKTYAAPSTVKNIDTLIYSKSSGVVKFTDTNGNIWIRSN